MRKSTSKIASLFLAGQSGAEGSKRTDGASFFLHGNKIAERCETSGDYMFSLAGWNKKLTRDTLNALFFCLDLKTNVYCRRGEAYVSESANGGTSCQISATQWFSIRGGKLFVHSPN